jgi:hypothetical protein
MGRRRKTVPQLKIENEGKGTKGVEARRRERMKRTNNAIICERSEAIQKLRGYSGLLWATS